MSMIGEPQHWIDAQPLAEPVPAKPEQEPAQQPLVDKPEEVPA